MILDIVFFRGGPVKKNTLYDNHRNNDYDHFKTKISMVIQAADIPPGVSLQRRNSAPEMSEPAQFVDHGSMEL